jgi:hypothetical protein
MPLVTLVATKASDPAKHITKLNNSRDRAFMAAGVSLCCMIFGTLSRQGKQRS